jgi:cell shape-determining protein MreD
MASLESFRMQKVLIFIVFLTLFDVFFVGLRLLAEEEEFNWEEFKVEEAR